jgi:hypothetical protein
MKRALCVLSTALLLAGCGVSRRPPSWVKWVPEAPPPEKAEFIAVPDDPAIVWQNGQWVRDDERWTWQAGAFTEPPRRNAVWVPGCWVERDGQWTWVDGSWR